MKYGVHLPLIDWDGTPFTIERFAAFAREADERGFDTIAANDHLVYRRPWLDGPTALAAVSAHAPRARLMTTVSLAVVRGPVALAKTLAAIDVLSGGRVVAGLGPGSTAADFEAVGIPFEQRWARFDEAVTTMRALWRGEDPPAGQFYDLSGTTLGPRPVRPDGPPIFIGSWGSDAGLRRVARLGDGWLASGYNTTPDQFVQARRLLGEWLAQAGREHEAFPNTIATMWLHVTEERSERDAVLDQLATMLRRDRSDLAATLPIGAAAHCAEIVARYREAGADRIIFWPVGDELRQLDRIGSL